MHDSGTVTVVFPPAVPYGRPGEGSLSLSFMYFLYSIINVWYAPVASVLWRCWLGGRKGIRPVKNFEWWGAGMVICLERGADLHMAQLMPLPLTVSCFSKIQIGFSFLVLAHLGRTGKRAVKRVCVCVCVGGMHHTWKFLPPYLVKHRSDTDDWIASLKKWMHLKQPVVL